MPLHRVLQKQKYFAIVDTMAKGVQKCAENILRAASPPSRSLIRPARPVQRSLHARHPKL
jgi:hypothetical protein